MNQVRFKVKKQVSYFTLGNLEMNQHNIELSNFNPVKRKQEVNMREIAKSWIHDLGVYEPGRPIEELARELGLPDTSAIVKLASNENPLGPSPKAMEALRRAVFQAHIYPDGSAFYLRRSLADKLNVRPDELLVGNGSNEILEFLGHVFLAPGDEVIVADRAFAVYKLVAAMFQARAKVVPMQNYTHDLEAMLQAVSERTKIIFITNPNNPTGTAVKNSDLDSFMERLPPHVLVCLDEAYVDLLPAEQRPDSLRYLTEGRRVVILRTFAKSHGLAGLRVGYAIAPREAIAMMHQIRQPFNVNLLGLLAAQAALDDDEHVACFQKLVQTELLFMMEGLDRLGLEYVPGTVNFIMVNVGNGRKVFEALQQKLVIVRPLDGYNLPAHIRISLGTRSENEKCLQALAEVMQMQIG